MIDCVIDNQYYHAVYCKCGRTEEGLLLSRCIQNERERERKNERGGGGEEREREEGRGGGGWGRGRESELSDVVLNIC